MADRGRDRDEVRAVGTRPHRGEGVTDVGRTMGGGSLGHAPADDVTAESDLRNNPPDASTDAGRVRQRHDGAERGAAEERAMGSDEEPVMPDDEATMKTKI